MYFKKTFIALTIILGLLVTISTAKAGAINIKGLEIGMSKKDIKKQLKRVKSPEFCQALLLFQPDLERITSSTSINQDTIDRNKGKITTSYTEFYKSVFGLTGNDGKHIEKKTKNIS